jgi:hypothetical protein
MIEVKVDEVAKSDDLELEWGEVDMEEGER